MRLFKNSLVALVACTLLGGTAFAGGAPRAPQATRAAAPKAVAPKATRATRVAKPLAPRPKLSPIERKEKEMKKWVWEEAFASYTEVVFEKGVTSKIVRHDEYDPAKGLNTSKLIKVSGAAQTGGKLKLTVMNTVSAHDLYREGMSDADFKTAVDARIASDFVRVSVRHPDGTTKIVADKIPSKDVTTIPVEVELKPGVNQIRVDRMNGQGYVVGSADMLGGRRVEIDWDGK
jgi:hypothetical protein